MKKRLTINERKVLFGLVAYPLLNDRQLSNELGVKHSTITAIRGRLRENDYYFTSRIPLVHNLGYELLVLGYGRFNLPAPDRLKEDFIRRLREENRGIFYLLRSSSYFFFASYVRNYTEFKRWTETLEYEFGATDALGQKRLCIAIFPVEISYFVRFFNFTNLLSIPFEIDGGEKVDLTFPRVSHRRLTKKEKIVLKGLVQYPEATDVAVSEKIDASRQVISNMRKRFEKEGLVKTVRILNPGKVGYKILLVGHVYFTPETPLQIRKDGIQRTLRTVPHYLNISGNSETVLIAAAQEYDDLEAKKDSILKYYASKGFLLGDPHLDLLSLKETKILANCDFSSLIDEAISFLP